MNLLQKYRLGKSQQGETFSDSNQEGECNILPKLVMACADHSFLIWVFFPWNFIINFFDADYSENQNRDIQFDIESSDGTKNPINE